MITQCRSILILYSSRHTRETHRHEIVKSDRLEEYNVRAIFISELICQTFIEWLDIEMISY